MRTPKPLYAHERLIYQPELLTCPHCGDLLVTCNYLAWDKTVQMLDRVVSVASRPGRCPHATCAGSRLRLLSAAGQRLAPAGSTYGYDVVVHIGWWRQESRATYREIHAALASRVRISESHVGYLYQQVYLPLLACHERQHRDRLAQIATQQGGLIVALDGLAPQGGEPQIWFIRELSSGVTLRSGWLCQQDQPPFEAFLEPLKHLEWPILVVLSDKQTGLVPAVATVLPHSRHQFCQAHYLRNLATPLAEADTAFKGELRKTVREHVGDLIRQEPRTASGHTGVLTVTGLLPSPLEKPPASATPSPTPRGAHTGLEPDADEVITQLLRHTRYLLTLKGRPPFRLAGMETYERLQHVADLSLDLLAQRYEPRLAQLYQGLQAALSPLAQPYQELCQGAAWLRDIAYILEPFTAQPPSAVHVAGQLRGYLDTVRRRPDVTPTLYAFGLHLDKVSRSYWPGLFHCYDVPRVPRTNNELESRFRDTGRRLLRTTGQQGLTQRTLQRQGAWELLSRPPTEAQLLGALCQTPPEDLAQERQRFAAHRQRFRLQSRSLKQTQAQFNQLRQRWLTIQPTGTG
ncbi:MAG TPA: transposase [Candidatus Tectomicrobia bacterium]|nr:transposase [Candidatus Tectomicrobia bacterium]